MNPATGNRYVTAQSAANLTRVPALMFLALICPNDVGAAASDAAAPLFDGGTTLHLTIAAPFTTIMQTRSDTGYDDGVLTYTDASGSSQELDIGLRTRGVYRRRKDVCDFAPLRLNFKRKEVSGTIFEGQDKIKLVTHCVSGRGRYDQYVLKEYFAYKVLQTLTDQSFRTRLVLLTYADTAGRKRTQTRYAFLIEEKEHLAERLQWTLENVPKIEHGALDKQQAMLVYVFEYFIGNTDFSLVLGARDKDCCHNVELFSSTPGRFIPVPYDFDLAGIVDTPYATPNPKYKLPAVTERLYRGRCEDNDLLPETLAMFAAKEQELRESLTRLEGLTRHRKREVREYIEDFYEDFETQRDLQKNFLKDCSDE